MTARAYAPSGARADAAGGLAGAASRWLAIAGTLSFFLISPMMLFDLGIRYGSASGSTLEKLHPGTLMIFAAAALAMFREGRPIAFAVESLERLPGLIPFALAWIWLVAHTVLVQRAPFTPMIDTFLMPMALLVLLERFAASARSRLAQLLHAALFLNAIIGLIEFRTGWRLTTYVAGDVLITGDWRSTALIGHPLANAIICGAYAVILALGGARDVPGWLRPVLLVVQMAGLVAFGGRTGLVLSVLFIAVIGAAGFLRFLRGGQVPVMMAAVVLTALPCLAVGLGALWESGFFDQLATRFTEDHGSAKSRIIMLQLFEFLDWHALLLGPDPAYIQSLQRLEGIEFGIESFVIAFILQYGLIVSLAFFAGLAFFCREIVRASRPLAAVPLLFFFLVALTSVSISAKTPSLGMLLALILTMMPPPAPVAPRRHRIA